MDGKEEWMLTHKKTITRGSPVALRWFAKLAPPLWRCMRLRLSFRLWDSMKVKLVRACSHMVVITISEGGFHTRF